MLASRCIPRNTLPAGKVGFTPEYAASNADTVNITIYGKGGHGASPESTVDPIVIAARVILSLQTIVSREIKPGDPAVITVGYIQGGTKNNIIPDEVHLGSHRPLLHAGSAQTSTGGDRAGRQGRGGGRQRSESRRWCKSRNPRTRCTTTLSWPNA